MHNDSQQRLKVAGQLLARALTERVEKTSLGLMAGSLPPFAERAFYDEMVRLGSAELFRIGLLGFDPLGVESDSLTYSAETAVEWRNDSSQDRKLIIILNPTTAQEKVHSLHMLEPFTDSDFYDAICQQAITQSTDSALKLWNFLVKPVHRKQLRLVATQLIDLYAELEAGTSINEAIAVLHLLPDEQLEAHLDDPHKHLFTKKTLYRLKIGKKRELDGLVRPGTKGQSEIMQTTASLQNQVTHPLFPISELFFYNTIPFDTPNRMFYTDTQARNRLVALFVPSGQLLTAWLLLRLNNDDIFWSKTLKTRILD